MNVIPFPNTLLILFSVDHIHCPNASQFRPSGNISSILQGSMFSVVIASHAIFFGSETAVTMIIFVGQ